MDMKKTQKGFLAAVLTAGMALAGCGGNENANPSATNGSSGGGSASGGKILIATQTPLSGPLSSVGEKIKQGAELALIQRQDEFKQLGFDLQLFPQDDMGDPKIGVANAEMLISNPDVLGVIGHYNTSVAIPSSVKYEEGKLVMVSPANTGVDLTKYGRKTVHRVCGKDDWEGPKAAEYAKNSLNAKKVFIIHDKMPAGQGLADEVKAQFEKDGVEIIGYEGITTGEKDYSAVVNRAIAANPDLIYFGGMYPEGGILVKQLREKGYKGIFMGGAGLNNEDFMNIAGPAAEGVIFTSVTGDVRQTEEGKKWAEEFEKTFGKSPDPFSAYAYDAMNVLLEGVKKAIEANGGNKPTREQVLEAVHNTTDYQGIITKVTFDENGDNKYIDVFVYKIENGQPVYLDKVQ